MNPHECRQHPSGHGLVTLMVGGSDSHVWADAPCIRGTDTAFCGNLLQFVSRSLSMTSCRHHAEGEKVFHPHVIHNACKGGWSLPINAHHETPHRGTNDVS
jgi:hypothetical protein